MSDKQLRLGVVGIPDGWSTQELVRAVEARTGAAILVDMKDVELDLDRGRVMSGAHDLCELDGLLVKKIAKAYSPDALDRVEVLRYVHGRGVRVFSNPDSMMPLIDRLSGTVRLRMGGVPMPKTVITENIAVAVDTVERFGRVIAKPLYTSKARGMTKFEAGDPDNAARFERYQADGNPVMYLQQMVDLPGQDLGVCFLGGEYLATYARVSQGQWTDGSPGAKPAAGKYRPAEPTEEIIEMARKAQALFDLDFTCVDVVETNEGPMCFEVSAFGGFRGLRDACGIDAAARYVDHAVKVLSHG